MMIARTVCFAFILILVPCFYSCSAPPAEIESAADYSAAIPTAPEPTQAPTAFPTEEIIQGTISIRHSWDETRTPTLAAIIKIFQSYYPDILFDVLSVPADTLLDYYITESSAGLGATILFGPAEWGPSLAGLDLAADLSGAFESPLLDSLNQPALQTGAIDGRLISLPYAISGVVLYRNSELITISPKTFDELVTLAQTTSRGNIIGAFMERSFFYSGAHLLGLGGQIIDSNNLPGFNNGTGVAWLELLDDFELAGPVCYFSDDDLERFQMGQVGWIIDGTWNLETLIGAIGIENLRVDPWPAVGSGKLSGFVQSENVYLNAQAEASDRSAALKFIQFMVASEAQTRLAEAGLIPASQRVFVTDKAYQTLLNQVITALNGGSAYPVHPEMGTYSLNLDLALRGFLDENLDPRQVLQSAQDAILVELEKPETDAAP